MRKNKKAVVTGGTRGIGLAIAKKLKKNGVEVLITGTSPHCPVEEDFRYYSVDFSSYDMLENFATFLQTYQPDVLVNNAGINKINDFYDIKIEDFLLIQQINTISPFKLCQAVLPAMKNNQWGRIVNITSILSKISKKGRASYSASKFGLDGMVAGLAAEVAEHGILVNGVAPGFIETDLTKKILGEQGIQDIINHIPIKRLGKPEEVANLVAWLVSDENTYVSGQNLVIDGGFTRV